MRAGHPADRRGALGRLAPAPFQLVECRVVLAPLASCEEAPFEGDTGAGRHPLRRRDELARCRFARSGAVEDRVRPVPIVGPLPDQSVEPPPVAFLDRFGPAIEVSRMILTTQDELVFADVSQVG